MIASRISLARTRSRGKVLDMTSMGAPPRRLSFGGDRIIYFRTLDDYQRLRALAERGQRFAVVVGGFIGSEAEPGPFRPADLKGRLPA